MRKERTEGGTLRDASYATLEGSAITPAAMKLVAKLNDRVVAQVCQYEQQQPDAPKANRAKLKRAVEAFLADLLTAHSNKRADGWVHRSMKAERFTGIVGHKTFKRLQQALKDLNLIEHKPGVNQWTRGFSDDAASGAKTALAGRWAARFRATPDLLKISASQGVPVSKAIEHFSFGLPAKPLQKRKAHTKAPYSRHKVRGALMKFTHTVKSSRLESDVRELNEFLDRTSRAASTGATFAFSTTVTLRASIGIKADACTASLRAPPTINNSIAPSAAG